VAKSLYVEIGQRIRRARAHLGMSQEELARHLEYNSPATVSHFESGDRKVSVADLQRIGSVLGVPLPFFLGDSADLADDRPFRLRAREVQPAARGEVVAFLSFAHKHGGSDPSLPPDVEGRSPNQAADRVLAFLGIEKPPVVPRDVAGRLRVPVFDWRFPDEISGIFVRDGDVVCIGVNETHPSVRQRFTIAHELGHLLLTRDRDLFVDFATAEAAAASDDEPQKSLETTANRFAACLLMPASWIKDDVDQHGIDATILAKRYGVSEQALWFRLLNLRLVQDTSD